MQRLLALAGLLLGGLELAAQLGELLDDVVVRGGGGLGAAALCGGGGQGDALLLRVPAQ